MPATTDLARETLQRQTELEEDRRRYEDVWETVATFCDPDAPDMLWRGGRRQPGESQAQRAQERGAQVYDNTIASARNRLAAGLESLIIPQSEKWHGLATGGLDDEETDEEKRWAEGLRDFLFLVRYTSAANWVPATQAVIRNIVTYGPAFLYAEEGYGDALIHYTSIPVNEAFAARNRYGVVDVFHRRYERTVRQVAQMMGFDRLPKNIQEMAADQVRQFERITMIQAVSPRDERRTYDLAGERIYLDSPFRSVHVIEDEEVVVKEGSFEAFPVSTFGWRRYEGETYSVSPTIDVLATVREVNAQSETILRALQQITDPSTASISQIDYTPILNPGENYPGLLDDQGQLKIRPIVTGQNIGQAFEYVNQRRQEIGDMMFQNVFQTLIQHPDMTATAALIRNEEKGQLLGPSGSVIQSGFSTNLDRELAILENKGLYEADSRFYPPESLAGKTLRPTFTSPLDVLRRAAESRDTISLVSTATEVAKAQAAAGREPDALDRFDFDEVFDILQQGSRAPRRIFKGEARVAEERAARERAATAQQGGQAISALAKTAKDAVPALAEARDKDLLPGLLPRPQQ